MRSSSTSPGGLREPDCRPDRAAPRIQRTAAPSRSGSGLPPFEDLVERHIRAAYAVAFSVLHRPHDAEDIAHDALLVAMQRLDECDPARFSGWLMRIVRNRALNAFDYHARRESAHRRMAIEAQPAAIGDFEGRDALRSGLDDAVRFSFGRGGDCDADWKDEGILTGLAAIMRASRLEGGPPVREAWTRPSRPGSGLLLRSFAQVLRVPAG